jgi:uracil-DNA glycosylase family 4
VVACNRCPELRAYCARIAHEKKRAYANDDYWGKPVPAFGDPHARVMLIGLAPGAHGSNRTGRMFTGDASGDFLYPALHRAGFASSPAAIDRHDGLRLHGCIITAAGRCAPPKNKPAPQQLRNCFPYLLEELRALPAVRAIVALGSVGFESSLKLLGASGFVPEQAIRPAFVHGAEYTLRRADETLTLLASYHPSRQNTNTGVLTAAMLDRVLNRARELSRKMSS